MELCACSLEDLFAEEIDNTRLGARLARTQQGQGLVKGQQQLEQEQEQECQYPDEVIVRMARGVAAGMVCLHSKGVIHLGSDVVQHIVLLLTTYYYCLSQRINTLPG